MRRLMTRDSSSFAPAAPRASPGGVPVLARARTRAAGERRWIGLLQPDRLDVRPALRRRRRPAPRRAGAGGRGRLRARYLSSAEIFDPATGSFSPTGSMSVPRPAPSRPRSPTAGCWLLGGCCASQPVLSSAEVFDPATNTFSSAGIGSMSVPRDGAVAAPLPDGRVLVAGGCCHIEGRAAGRVPAARTRPGRAG